MKKKLTLASLLMAAVLLVFGCGKDSSADESKSETVNAGDPIIVSTMNDTEGEILGRMMVLALQDAGYEVVDNTFGYTGTVNGRTALLEDETDIYMDYTGRGLRLIEGVDVDLFRDLQTAWETVSEWDQKNNGLTWLSYAPFTNADALAVTREFAEENNVHSVKDFADYVNKGGDVKLLAHDYYISLESGLPGMEEAYGFDLSEDQYTIGATNVEQILNEGTDGVNVAHIYSSSGLVETYDLVVLEDPEHVSPVYSPAPIIRSERLEAYPGVADVLNPVFESITLEEMVKMNAKVQVDGASGMDVAREYLLSKDLISE